MIWFIVLKEISDKHAKYKYGVHTYSNLLTGQLQLISTWHYAALLIYTIYNFDSTM